MCLAWISPPQHGSLLLNVNPPKITKKIVLESHYCQITFAFESFYFSHIYCSHPDYGMWGEEMLQCLWGISLLKAGTYLMPWGACCPHCHTTRELGWVHHQTSWGMSTGPLGHCIYVHSMRPQKAVLLFLEFCSCVCMFFSSHLSYNVNVLYF